MLMRSPMRYLTGRRAPQGARGLKSLMIVVPSLNKPSRPARGAWIEINGLPVYVVEFYVAPRKGRVD